MSQFLRPERILLDQAKEILLLVDADNLAIIEANATACSMLGYSLTELLGKSITELESSLPDMFYWEEVQQGNIVDLTAVEGLYLCADGSFLPVTKCITSVRANGRSLLILRVQDIRLQRKTEEDLASISSRLRATLEATVDGILVMDLEQRIVSMNHRFSAMWSIPEALIELQDDQSIMQYMASRVMHSARYLQRLQEIEHAFDEESSDVLELSADVIIERKSRPQYLGDQIIGRVYSFSNITERVKSEKLIWEQAYFDALTGLPNRRLMRDRLEQEVKKVDRTQHALALMFIDLDLFKEVNDTLGHDMGDLLLKEAGRRLRHCVRETDTVARLGGDEFTILMCDLRDSSNVERVIRNLLSQLAEPFQLGDETAYISASIGVTFYPADAKTVEELIRNADQAMYAAKHQGRNRFSYFTPALQEAAQARMRLAKDLRSALADKQFCVVYQPIIQLDTGAIHKAEALLRWHHPTRGVISPTEFIPIAEETGLIIEIGNWVFRQAAEQVKKWRASRHPRFQISVNKSPIQFRHDSDSGKSWFEHLESLDLPGQSIVVEITEGLLLEASAGVNGQLKAFREAGIAVSLDDFGTGYSSLSYLHRFDIDYLKIDQSFVRNLTPASKDMALCETIIVMAHKLGMKVIAEGVETVEQRALLMAAGCDYGQGFLFSKPMASADFDAFPLSWYPTTD